RNIHMGKEVLQAIVDAASQTATPTFVASLSISIVFIPIFLLTGPAAALFRPLAMAGGAFKKIHIVFDGWFEQFRLAYLDAAAWAIGHRRQVLGGAGLFVGVS